LRLEVPRLQIRGDDKRMGPLIGVQVVRPILAQLSRAGIDPSAFLAAFGLLPDLLDEPDRVIPFPGPVMWEHAAQEAKDAMFGLHAAENVQIESFDVFSYVISAAPTVRESLSRVARYINLLSNFVGYELRDTGAGGGDKATFEYQSQLPPSPAMDQFALGVPHRYGNLFAKEEWRLLGVTFRHAPPAEGDEAEYERVFGAPVEFSAARDALFLERRLLDVPLRTKDPRMLAILDRVALEWMKRVPASERFVDRVRREIADECHGGRIELKAIAKRMRVSARSLQRRLQHEGLSFKRVVDDVRRELAMKYLSTDLSVSEIAFLLGFSDRAVFHRAFKRWSGVTPEVFRHTRARASMGARRH
jgi:AraC-like DNA-binding protein